jgi:ribosome-binding factor A
MRQFKRVDRVRSQMLRDVRVLLEQECASKLDAMVTFTDVELTGDLRYATIFYSVLGEEKSKQKVFSYLKKIAKRVKGDLGNLLNIKHVPEVKFEFDPSIERGMKIERLLNEISQENDKGREENI